MKYENIKKGIFLSRPNRFIANIIADGKPDIAHVKNTGRCRELLLEGAEIYLEEHDNPKRKTKWSLISVVKDGRLVNIDSQAPNRIFHEWLSDGKGKDFFNQVRYIKPEYVYKNSRLDFYIKTPEDRILIEVKGATLEENGIAMFPDAPTERGVKHIYELCGSIEEGYRAYVVFIIQMKGIEYFTPNARMHKEFAEALKYAKTKGVKVLAFDCRVGRDYLEMSEEVRTEI